MLSELFESTVFDTIPRYHCSFSLYSSHHTADICSPNVNVTGVDPKPLGLLVFLDVDDEDLE